MIISEAVCSWASTNHHLSPFWRNTGVLGVYITDKLYVSHQSSVSHLSTWNRPNRLEDRVYNCIVKKSYDLESECWFYNNDKQQLISLLFRTHTYIYILVYICGIPCWSDSLVANMRPTARLLQAVRITLFTRENCGLCTKARSVLSDVWDSRPFDFKEVDIIKSSSDSKPRWRDLYEFDVPVVGCLWPSIYTSL